MIIHFVCSAPCEILLENVTRLMWIQTQDYDCFYAAVFEAKNPSLKALPFAVQQKQIIGTARCQPGVCTSDAFAGYSNHAY